MALPPAFHPCGHGGSGTQQAPLSPLDLLLRTPPPSATLECVCAGAEVFPRMHDGAVPLHWLPPPAPLSEVGLRTPQARLQGAQQDGKQARVGTSNFLSLQLTQQV